MPSSLVPFPIDAMSTTERIIKNTVYLYLTQLVGFLFPLFLTPFILSTIGQVEFGIYALVIGYVGTLGVLDLSISSAFVRFIAEYLTKHDDQELNNVVNTGFLFYTVFSLLLSLLGFFLAPFVISLMNIPPDLQETSVLVFRISLIGFFFSSAFSVFVSVLISLHEMYVTSIITMVMGSLNLIATIILLESGYRLLGLAWVQAAAGVVTAGANLVIALRKMPQLRMSPVYWSSTSLRKMLGMGIQMQMSKLSGFAGERYDEFLLGLFSSMQNVAYFNIAARISRMARLVPVQLVPLVAPVATELHAKGEERKLQQLFTDITKYLLFATTPIMFFVAFAADTIVYAWIGVSLPIAVHILRILAIGQIVNLTFSAPGNAITPNIGVPRFQMYEGFISLIINLVLSYFLIKSLGGLGAAFGSTTAVVIAALYVFAASVKFFRHGRLAFLRHLYIKPVAAGVVALGVTYFCELVLERLLFIGSRATAFIELVVLGIMFTGTFTIVVLNSNYLEERGQRLLARFVLSLIPTPILSWLQKRLLIHKYPPGSAYDGELVSLFVVTHNRVSMMRQCIDALIPTLSGLNWELIIWDNKSDDGTRDYLQQFENHQRIRLVEHPENIGTNAKGKAAALCSGDFIIGIDDDVIRFPDRWVQDMIYAYKNILAMGYLAANVVQDDSTTGAKHPQEMYKSESYDDNGLILEVGPTGGWCFLVSRDVYETVGPLKTLKNRIFFMEDADYVNRVIDKGFKYGILRNVKVYHATGIAHNRDFDAVYSRKMADQAQGFSLSYKIKRKLVRLFSPLRYLRTLVILGTKEDGFSVAL